MKLLYSMKADIVFPKNNEEEFISIALKLGYKEICFCYSLSNFKKYKSDKIKIFYAIQLEKLEQLSMAKKKTDCVIVKNPSRKFFEKKIHMVYDLLSDSFKIKIISL